MYEVHKNKLIYLSSQKKEVQEDFMIFLTKTIIIIAKSKPTTKGDNIY